MLLRHSSGVLQTKGGSVAINTDHLRDAYLTEFFSAERAVSDADLNQIVVAIGDPDNSESMDNAVNVIVTAMNKGFILEGKQKLTNVVPLATDTINTVADNVRLVAEPYLRIMATVFITRLSQKTVTEVNAGSTSDIGYTEEQMTTMSTQMQAIETAMTEELMGDVLNAREHAGDDDDD